MNPPSGVNPALARLQASVRIGGKGTVRRKKKVVHKTTTTDDKRLQNTLKRLGINSIPAIEQVHLLNCWDGVNAKALKGVLETLVIGGGGLVHNLLLPAHSALAANSDRCLKS